MAGSVLSLPPRGILLRNEKGRPKAPPLQLVDGVRSGRGDLRGRARVARGRRHLPVAPDVDALGGEGGRRRIEPGCLEEPVGREDDADALTDLQIAETEAEAP